MSARTRAAERAKRRSGRARRTTRIPVVLKAGREAWSNPFPLSSDSKDEHASRKDRLARQHAQSDDEYVSSASDTERDPTSRKGQPRRSWLLKFPSGFDASLAGYNSKTATKGGPTQKERVGTHNRRCQDHAPREDGSSSESDLNEPTPTGFVADDEVLYDACLLYTSPSPRD